MESEKENDNPGRSKRNEAMIDLLAVAGSVSVTIGAGLVYLPAGFIVGGLICIAAAVLLARAG